MKKKIDLTLDVVIREIPDEDKHNENKAEQKKLPIQEIKKRREKNLRKEKKNRKLFYPWLDWAYYESMIYQIAEPFELKEWFVFCLPG